MLESEYDFSRLFEKLSKIKIIIKKRGQRPHKFIKKLFLLLIVEVCRMFLLR